MHPRLSNSQKNKCGNLNGANWSFNISLQMFFAALMSASLHIFFNIQIFPHLDMVIHLEQDWAGGGHVSVTLPQILCSIEAVLRPVLAGPGQGAGVPGEGAAAARAVLILRQPRLEAGQLAQQPGQLQLAPPLLKTAAVSRILRGEGGGVSHPGLVTLVALVTAAAAVTKRVEVAPSWASWQGEPH